ncbi:hypothetical protein ACGFJ7_09845 [Actinoplanes sp. NPDC048988]|uniref:hypothetical protein n=1 Tax=Actinoplanes sp. NPDC048988 TaxID=3363901 RepID=UPI0037207605
MALGEAPCAVTFVLSAEGVILGRPISGTGAIAHAVHLFASEKSKLLVSHAQLSRRRVVEAIDN